MDEASRFSFTSYSFYLLVRPLLIHVHTHASNNLMHPPCLHVAISPATCRSIGLSTPRIRSCMYPSLSSSHGPSAHFPPPHCLHTRYSDSDSSSNCHLYPPVPFTHVHLSILFPIKPLAAYPLFPPHTQHIHLLPHEIIYSFLVLAKMTSDPFCEPVLLLCLRVWSEHQSVSTPPSTLPFLLSTAPEDANRHACLGRSLRQGVQLSLEEVLRQTGSEEDTSG